jgi:hypothetical protein
MICWLHNLWSPFKIPFYLVSPIVFLFRAHAFFYLGTICRFSWNGTCVSHWRFHDNRHVNTSVDVSKLYQFMLNVEFCLSRCSGAWTVVCTWQYRPWTGAIKPILQQFQFCRVGLSVGILIFSFFNYKNLWQIWPGCACCNWSLWLTSQLNTLS